MARSKQQRVGAAQLGDAIIRALQEYTDDVSAAVAEEVERIAIEAKDEIKANSPVGARRRYKKGWRVKKLDRSGSTRRVIHNATDYQLVHLLEKGHAKRGGGRVAAIEHVGPVAEKYSVELEDNLRRIVKNGGKP